MTFNWIQTYYNDEPTNWIKGTYEDYFFQAKVFDFPSCYGLNEGRISKLFVSSEDEGEVICYDRRWDFGEPDKEHHKLLRNLVNEIESNVPTDRFAHLRGE